MASMAASISSEARTGSMPRAAARTRGWRPDQSDDGTPTSSPMTAMGSGSAKSDMNSTSPFSAMTVEQAGDEGCAPPDGAAPSAAV